MVNWFDFINRRHTNIMPICKKLILKNELAVFKEKVKLSDDYLSKKSALHDILPTKEYSQLKMFVKTVEVIDKHDQKFLFLLYTSANGRICGIVNLENVDIT